MKILGLPGRNPETGPWMKRLFDGLGPPSCTIASYRHWVDGRAPDVDAEAARVQLNRDNLVIAKSMGTLVLLAAVERQGLPGAAVMIGTPIDGYTESNRSALLALTGRIPVLFVQQTADFTGGFESLRAVLNLSSGTPNESFATLAEVPGEDHQYEDVNGLMEIIGRWYSALETDVTGQNRHG